MAAKKTHKFSGIEKRRAARIACSCTVRLRRAHSLWGFKGQVRNLSLLGAQVEVSQPLAEGDFLRVRFKIAGLPSTMVCDASVVWVGMPYTKPGAKQSVYHVGLAFKTLSSDNKRWIDQAITDYFAREAIEEISKEEE